MDTKPFFYLASPYTHPDPEVRRKRHRSALVATKAVMLKGFSVFSPIVHSVPLAADDVSPNFHDFWMNIDLPILAKSAAVILLPIDGWQQSKGVKAELDMAESLGIPIKTFAEFLAEAQ